MRHRSSCRRRTKSIVDYNFNDYVLQVVLLTIYCNYIVTTFVLYGCGCQPKLNGYVTLCQHLLVLRQVRLSEVRRQIVSCRHERRAGVKGYQGRVSGAGMEQKTGVVLQHFIRSRSTPSPCLHIYTGWLQKVSPMPNTKISQPAKNLMRVIQFNLFIYTIPLYIDVKFINNNDIRHQKHRVFYTG